MDVVLFLAAAHIVATLAYNMQ